MTVIDLNKDWRVLKNRASDFDFEIPTDADSVNLPYDMLPETSRSYDLPYGEYNGFYDSSSVVLYKRLPGIGKHEKVLLDISGACGIGELSVNGSAAGEITTSSHILTDITDLLSDSNNIIRIKLCSYSDSGRYTGLGIGGGVKLFVVKNRLHITPQGVFVRTVGIDQKAYLSVSVCVANDFGEPKQFGISAEVFNAKNKRTAKKFKKVKLAAHSEKTFELPVKMNRHFVWSNYDPYLYRLKVSLNAADGDAETDAEEQRFGIVMSSLTPRGLKINGETVKLKGAVVMRDNGLLGNASDYCAEYRKLKSIKDCGFNAVRFIGCPSDAALNAADELGLYACVDFFDNFGTGKFVNDGHLFFGNNYKAVTESTVKALRNHPCCIMYGLCNDAEESYGRNGGVETAKNIIEIIRRFDKYKITTANAFERAPTVAETAEYEVKIPKGIGAEDNAEKKLIALAREKDLFRKCTDAFFSLVDVAGYSYLHPRYSSDKSLGRMIVGLASHSEKAFDVLEEVEKTPYVIGDFVFAAYDFIGKQDARFSKDNALVKPYINTSGLFDITGRKKDSAYYSEILLGNRNSSYIVAEDPETVGEDGEIGELTCLWNWPKNIGKPIRVFVYTGGDIVALFLDGKSVGRKLAGKFNKHTAEFKLNFYPGRLEAVSYRKGKEVSRCCIESVAAPRMLKIDCGKKILSDGELSYLDICVADKEGRTVPFAVRDVEVTVSGEGELVALGNGDPESLVNPLSSSCPVYNGVCTAVIRGKGEGKISVKATSEGLLSNKATLKVR